TAPNPLLAPVTITVRPANDCRSAAVQSVMTDNSSYSDVEFQGQRGGSGDPCHARPWAWSGLAGVGHAPGDHPKSLGQLQPGQVSADAVMHAAAEVQDGRWVLTGDVEALGVLVDVGVAVGAGGVGSHQGTGGNVDSGQFDVFGGSPDG